MYKNTFVDRPPSYSTPLHRDLNQTDAVIRDLRDQVHGTSRSKHPRASSTSPQPGSQGPVIVVLT